VHSNLLVPDHAISWVRRRWQACDVVLTETARDGGMVGKCHSTCSYRAVQSAVKFAAQRNNMKCIHAIQNESSFFFSQLGLCNVSYSVSLFIVGESLYAVWQLLHATVKVELSFQWRFVGYVADSPRCPSIDRTCM
jgi:hypothetical protein